MINENLIPAHDGTNFEINKVTKVNSDNEEYVISELKYKRISGAVLHLV